MLEPKNIIFDLGGVIIDLEIEKCMTQFRNLGYHNTKELLSSKDGSSLLERYERGEIESDYLLSELQRLFPGAIENRPSISCLKDCWNLIIGKLPQRRLRLLEELKTRYNVFLLSNTCKMHIDFINDKISQEIVQNASLNDYFKKCYYSFEMGLSKPNPAIYREVLVQNGLIAEQSLFIDDNLNNIQAAAELNIQTFHHQKGDVCDLFNNGVWIAK